MKVRTVIALLRIRYCLKERRGNEVFAEEIVTTGFRRVNGRIEWLPANGEEVLGLLKSANPIGNISSEERGAQVEWVLEILRNHQDGLRGIADQRARELEESHARLREYTGGGRIQAEPYPPDVLAVYVFVPRGGR